MRGDDGICGSLFSYVDLEKRVRVDRSGHTPAMCIYGEPRMKIDGRCHCGEITFEAEVDPDALNICHCTDCQTLSGSACRVNIAAPAEHFALLSGTPKTYIKTAESGNKRLHAFCSICGTPIYSS